MILQKHRMEFWQCTSARQKGTQILNPGHALLPGHILHLHAIEACITCRQAVSAAQQAQQPVIAKTFMQPTMPQASATACNMVRSSPCTPANSGAATG